MDFGTLVTAVLVYMKNHYPNTPDEFNFQAEPSRKSLVLAPRERRFGPPQRPSCENSSIGKLLKMGQ